MNRDETGSAGAVEGAEAVVRELSGLAGTVRIGPVPYAAVQAGGRRRVVRRRSLLTGVMALAVVAGVGGVAAVNGGVNPSAGPGPLAAASAPLAPGAQSAQAPATAAGQSTAPGQTATPAPADPLTPVRVRMASGTKDGKPWTAWAALWPAVSKEQALQQAELIWQEDKAAGATDSPPTQDYVDQYRHAGHDQVVFYLVMDGKRVSRSQQSEQPARGVTPFWGTPPPGSTPPGWVDDLFGGVAFHAWAKNGADDPFYGAPAVGFFPVGPEAARAEAKWADGTVTQPPIVTIGDSPVRWFAVVGEPDSYKAALYRADGTPYATQKG
ncbi:hypothetical protein [Kitasatospora sp. NBC_00458]|uniref:hypothetical protein n=1 Tax=Kitasatospora sp. NBC_00458 TaxID=2903568 RepID=UPI002E1854F6